MKKPYNGWWVVFASTLGLVVTEGPVMTFSFGVFLSSFENEFGWSRGQISFAFTLSFMTAAVMMPIAGRVMDVVGARLVALWAIALFGLTVISLYFVPGNLWIFYAWFVVIGITAGGAAPGPFARVISAWFDKRRGLALGISMAGVGLGATIIPLIARTSIAAFGWRGAYVVIGCVILSVLPVLLWLLHNEPRDMGGYVDNDPETESTATQNQSFGLSAREAIKQPSFWVLLVVFFIAALTINGSTVHLVPMLTDRGVSFEAAAGAVSVIGLSLIFGRLVAGYLLDRLFAPYVAIAFLCGPIVGLLLLSQGAVGSVAVLSAALFGLGTGAEIDLIGYMVSRYFGLKAFGEIYGYLFAIFIVGTGIGPVMLGFSFDNLGGYGPMLVVFAGLLGLSCLLMLRLGDYPDLKKTETAAEP